MADMLTEAFVGMDHCITDAGRNLIVEVPKGMCDAVRTALKQRFQDVALIRNAYPMMEDLHDFILVKPLISESPVFQNDGVSVPDLEKRLVDYDADKEYASLTDQDIQRVFQRAVELYPVNTSRLLRYAGRKGKKEEIQGKVGAEVGLDIIADPLLNDSQCIIETDGGIFDCSIDTELDNLIREIRALS